VLQLNNLAYLDPACAWRICKATARCYIPAVPECIHARNFNSQFLSRNRRAQEQNGEENGEEKHEVSAGWLQVLGQRDERPMWKAGVVENRTDWGQR